MIITRGSCDLRASFTSRGCNRGIIGATTASAGVQDCQAVSGRAEPLQGPDSVLGRGLRAKHPNAEPWCTAEAAQQKKDLL